MIIANKFNRELIEEVNKLLNLNLPTDKDSYETPYNNFQDYPIGSRLDKIIDEYPNMPILLLISKKTDEGDYIQNMYRNDWKRVPKLINGNRHVIWYHSEDEYLYLTPNKTIKKWYSKNGLTRVIDNIIMNMKYPVSLMDHQLIQYYIAKNKTIEYAKNQIANYEQLYFFNKEFVERINIIFNGLDVDNLDIIRDTVYKYTDLDIFKAKLIYVLYFKDNPTYTMIRRFTGMSESNYLERTDTQHNARQYAEDFIEACDKFIGLKMDITKIYEDVEEISMDELYLQQAVWTVSEEGEEEEE